MSSRRNEQSYIYPGPTRPEYPTPPPSFFAFTDNDSSTVYYSSPTITPVDFDVVAEMSLDNDTYCPLPGSDTPVTAIMPSLSLHDDMPDLPGATDDVVVSISTSFNTQNQPTPDTVLLSADGVLFYVNSQKILSACADIFKAYIPTPLISPEYRTMPIPLDTPASQLNVILHTLHGTSPAANSPDFDTLIASIDHMPRYGMTPRLFIRPTTPIHELLLSYSPLRPMDLYALGAFHTIPTLCATASAHLLSFNLSTITDEMANRIGAVYLKKLMLLHLERSRALRNILLQPPHPHPSTKHCTFEDQRRLTRAWALVGAYLVWDAKPDLSTFMIKSTLNPLLDNLDCPDCRAGMQKRIKDVLAHWASERVSDPCSFISIRFLTGRDAPQWRAPMAGRAAGPPCVR